MALDSRKRNTNSLAGYCVLGIVFIPLIAVPMIFAIFAVSMVWGTLNFLPGTVSAQGTILSCEMVTSKHGPSCLPTVRFQTSSGQRIIFQSSTASNTFTEEDSVTVRYHPNNPGDARVDSGIVTWLPLIFLLPLVIVLTNLVLFFRRIGPKGTASISSEMMNSASPAILARPKEVQDVPHFFERHPPERLESLDIYSPEIHELGKMYQLGSLEAVYRINVRAGIVGLIIWNLLVLFIGGLFVTIPGRVWFFNGHFQLPPMSLLPFFSCFLPFPLLMLSVGIAGLVITICQQHTRLYVYTQGLLLHKRRHGPVQAVTWEQISHVRCYMMRSSKGGTHHHYDITCSNGQRLSFNGQYINYKELFAHIDRALVRVHLPDLLQRYEQDELISFGRSLFVNRGGIHFGPSAWHAGSYSWSEIDSVQFSDDAMRLFLNLESKPIVHTLAVIDNLCLLRALVERVHKRSDTF